ncbi:peroxidase 43 [Senna tora]|uniref:Peroxidase 43 n=1 Tax=Senna tora TaxID=362788 RepID=A0A834W7A6_9FABA|nr:peroxidase 43 [Senna tora]
MASSFPYSRKCMNLLLQQQQNDSQSPEADGPLYQVPTRRRDGLVSNVTLADDMPEVSDSIFLLKAKFLNKGLTPKDLVLLSGFENVTYILHVWIIEFN